MSEPVSPRIRGYFRKRVRDGTKKRPKVIEFIEDDFAWLSGQADMRKISFPTLMDEVIAFYRRSLEEAEQRIMAEEAAEEAKRKKADAPPPLADHHTGERIDQTRPPEEPEAW